jgi:hypothetical protein
MPRIGLTPDELAATWSAEPRRYAAHVPGLDVLVGETIALVGEGTTAALEQLVAALGPRTAWVDGAAAVAGGSLRIHAQQAARVGVRALAVTGPIDAELAGAGIGLAVADLAGVGELGLTTVVEVADAALAALFADRVAVVRERRITAAYPVVSPFPRVADDVAPVVERVASRLRATPAPGLARPA